MTTQHTVSRRQFLISTAAVGGSFILGFYLPRRAAQAADIAPNIRNAAREDLNAVL